MVSTSRCGRDNPGSNPGYSILFQFRQLIDRAKRYADRVSKSASDVTQTVVNRQNTLRRRLNERIKSVAAVDVANRDNWRLIVAQLRLVSF